MALRHPLVLALLLALPLAACGDDGDDNDTGGSGSASASSSASASGSSTEDTAGDTDDTDGTDDGSSSDAEASDAFCDQADTLANDDSLDDMDPEDPEAIALVTQLLNDWADEAPDDVGDDIRSLVSSFEEMLTAFNDPAFAEDPEALERLEELTAESEEAATRVEDFVLEACGVDLGGDEE